MSKRGQIYLFAAIIVCMIAFTLIVKSNYIREQVLLQNFKDISSNYLTESPKVVNGAIESSGNLETSDEKLEEIKNQLSDFTDSFVDNYAKNQDPNVGLIYIYNDENGLVIQNSLNEKIVHFKIEGGGDYSLFSTTEPTEGSICVSETGLCGGAEANLCEVFNNEENVNYCIIKSGISGDIALKIGEPPVYYNFKIDPESPELIVILQSKEGETVKVDVSENKL